MPLPLKDRKIGAVEYVIKRLKGSDSYDKMKEHNENYGSEKLAMREKPEQDYKSGMKMAVSEMMTAMQSNDADSFEKNLREYVCMLMEEKSDDDEMFEKD